MENVINSLKSIEIYCNTILNKPSGSYSTESTIMAGVIKEYAKEGMVSFKKFVKDFLDE